MLHSCNVISKRSCSAGNTNPTLASMPMMVVFDAYVMVIKCQWENFIEFVRISAAFVFFVVNAYGAIVVD
jgi:hypothetical protein